MVLIPDRLAINQPVDGHMLITSYQMKALHLMFEYVFVKYFGLREFLKIFQSPAVFFIIFFSCYAFVSIVYRMLGD